MVLRVIISRICEYVCNSSFVFRHPAKNTGQRNKVKLINSGICALLMVRTITLGNYIRKLFSYHRLRFIFSSVSSLDYDHLRKYEGNIICMSHKCSLYIICYFTIMKNHSNLCF